MLDASEQSTIKALSLVSLDGAWAGISNSLIGCSVGFVAPNGSSSQLEFIPPTQRAAAALLKIKLGGHLFELRVSQPATMPAVNIAIRDDLPSAIWQMAVEEAASDWIRLISEASGKPTVLVELSRHSDAAPLNLSLGVRLSRVGQADHGTIDVTASDIAGWQWVARHLRDPVPKPAAVIDPVMTLSFRLRPVCVAIAELRTLQLGDIVLLDESQSSATQLPLRCVIGERIVNGINAISDGIAIKVSKQPIKELSVTFEPTVNPRATRTSPRAGDTATPEIPQGPDVLDSLEMWLEFEVGRTKMSLGQIRALVPGQILVASGDDSTRDVRVLCNGRWIATGRLVEIGEKMGVQVTNLAGVEAVPTLKKDQQSKTESETPLSTPQQTSAVDAESPQGGPTTDSQPEASPPSDTSSS